MIEYQCSSCGREYSNQEYRELKRVQAVKDEVDPTARDGHGYHAVCECGHEFHADEWHKEAAVESEYHEFRVSTTHLVLNHGHGDDDLWYETCVFWDSGNRVLDRYETQSEAKEGHERIVKALENGQYNVQNAQICNLEITEKNNG